MLYRRYRQYNAISSIGVIDGKHAMRITIAKPTTLVAGVLRALIVTHVLHALTGTHALINRIVTHALHALIGRGR